MQLGWIGTGIMGASMASHWLAAGHRLKVFTRTPAKAESLLQQGAEWADSPAAAVAEVTAVMVGYPRDVEAVMLGEEGVLATARKGSVVIDFTTSSPSLAEDLAGKGEERGVDVLDAPVSGGDVGAREARLSIMVGGRRAAFDRLRPLLDLLGKTVVYQGAPGSGQHTKMVNQTLIAANMVGVCEGLLYARAAGLDPVTVLQSVGSGAAGSWSLTNLYPRMVNSDFEPGFMIEHFVKDMGLALEESRRMGLELPGLEMAYNLYRELVAAGCGRKGTQALIRALDGTLARRKQDREPGG